MMIALRFSAVFFLALLETVFFTGGHLCNLMILYVVYLALEARLSQGLFFTALAGLVLDGLSGAPSGVFSLTFLWIFFIVHWLRGFLRSASFLFALLAILAGILLENLFMLLAIAFAGQGGGNGAFFVSVVPMQLLSGAVAGPLLLSGFRGLNHLVCGSLSACGEDDNGCEAA